MVLRPIHALIPLVPTLIGVAWQLREEPEPSPSHTSEELHEAQEQLRELVEALMFKVDAVPLRPSDLQQRVANSARQALGRAPRGGFRDDCSGFVSEVYSAAGVPMDGTVASIHELAVLHDALFWDEAPQVGDLVFFDDTWDRNGNGSMDDPLTHVAMVVDVEPDGRLKLAQAGTSRGRSFTWMDPSNPTRHKDARGDVRNAYLRGPTGGDVAGLDYLTGELFVGYARIYPQHDWLTPFWKQGKDEP